VPSFNTVRALQRGLEVLQVVNRHGGLRAQTVAQMTKLPRPTAYRLLETLETLGFVALGPSDDGWRPTLKAKSLSSGFRDEAWVAQVAMPSIMALGRKVLWPVDLVTFSNYALVVRESTHVHSPFSVDIGMVGRELPLLLTSGGRAYLAFSPEAERNAVLDVLRASERLEHALARKPATVEKILDRVRALGVGYRTEGFRANTSSISAAILHEGRVLACVTIVWIKTAMELKEAIERYSEPLHGTCRKIAESLSDCEPIVEPKAMQVS